MSAPKLTEAEREFLTAVRDESLAALGWVNRAADRARQSTRRRGLSVCDKRTGRQAWHLTEAGRLALQQDHDHG